MNTEDLRGLLRYVVSMDGRIVTDLTVAAWYDVLAPYSAADAREAARLHYETSTERFMPAHVVAYARQRTRSLPPAYYAPNMPAIERGHGADPEHVSAVVTRARAELARQRSARRAITGEPAGEEHEVAAPGTDATRRTSTGPLTKQELDAAAALIAAALRERDARIRRGEAP